jgi:carboxyl-terminal processing protease
MNGRIFDMNTRNWRIALAFLSGIALGWFGSMGCATSHREPDFELMGQAWDTIQEEYVNRKALQSKELTYGAISGMVDALGDTGHSTFLTPDMVKELRHVERGEFKGVGIEIQMKNGRVVVVAPVDDSPAQKAGVHAGDVLLKVAGEDVSDWPLSRVVERISGRAGTKVTLTLQDPRDNHTRQVTLTRTSIKLHEVTWSQLPETKIAHVRVATFDAGVTRDLRKALTDIQGRGMTGVILDLRDNPGGLLDEAVGVASQFLKDGNVLLAKDAKGRIEPVPVDKDGVALNLPVAVLINQGTASAAEIVAGALRDGNRAQLIGEASFGTGTVLQQFRLSDGSALLLAVEEWLTPKGESFWHKGIEPEQVVALPPEITPLLPAGEKEMTSAQLHASPDQQLLKAISVLEEQIPKAEVRRTK